MRWAKFLMNSEYQTHYPDPYVAVGALCLFLTIPWVGLQCVIVALPGHTHLLFVLDSADRDFQFNSTNKQKNK